MTSDMEPVEELDLSPRERGLKTQGAIAGAVAGAVVGLADAGTAVLSGHEIVTAADVPKVVLAYAVAFLPCGFVAALIAQRFAWRRRALSLLISLGSALFFVVGWLNVHALPGFLSGPSLIVDILALGAALFVFRRAYFGPGTDDIAIGRWIGVAGLAALVAWGFSIVGPERDDGPQVAASRADGAPRPNVLVYMVDTLRADHLGCYGYARRTSPEVDAFAKDAVLFTDCFAPTSWTKPSVASTLTGMYPSAHGCIQQREVLVPEAETLAEILRAGGWRTGAFVDNPFIAPEFGFGQGFDSFDGVRPSVIANGTLLGKALFMTRVLSLVGKPFGVGDETGRGVRELQKGLLKFIDLAPSEPWFAYVHSMEPHLPYDPPLELALQFGFPQGEDYEAPPAWSGMLPFDTAPEPIAGLREKLVAQYDGEVSDLSMAFGELRFELEQRKLWENTIIVFVSDHGEEFRERGGWTHGHSLFRELVHVPLIVRLPESMGELAVKGRGRRVLGYATLMDLTPTLLELCDVAFDPAEPRRLSGRSLVENLRGTERAQPSPAVRADRAILGEIDMGPSSLRSIIDGRWQLFQASRPLGSAEELYDASSDPAQDRPKEESAALTERVRLRDKIAKAFDALETVSLRRQEREIDAETENLLKDIGYLGGR